MVDNNATRTSSLLSSVLLTSAQLIKLNNNALKIAQKLEDTVKNQDYQRTIKYASEASDELIPQIQLILYDIRANAYSMQGHFESAIQDTQRMIGQAPTVAAGYLRKATVCSMYGKQIQAIEAYDEGVQITSCLSSSYNTAETIQSLSIGRAKAVAINEKRVDFFPVLAFELADNIVSRLSQTARLTCLGVSKRWRNKMKECRDGWQSLYIYNNRDDIKLLSLLPHITCYTKHLVIDTSYGVSVNPLYLKYMREGKFNKIESIKLTALVTKEFQPYSGMLMVALWQTRQRLTNLSLDMGNTNANVFTLSDILSICTHLTDFVYLNSSTNNTVSLMGDFTMIKEHNALVSLQLQLQVINETSLRVLMERCPKLQRLVMDGCDVTALNVLVAYSDRLEIIGFNSDVPVPQLQRKPTDDNKTCNTALRSLYIVIPCHNNEISFVSHMLNIMQKNQITLETVYVFAQGDNPAGRNMNLQLSNPSLSFEHLKSMTFASFHPEVENILRQSITKSTCFTELCIPNIANISKLVDASITMPPLSKLRINQNDVIHERQRDYHYYGRDQVYYYTTTGERRQKKNYADLSRLFQYYAKISAYKNSLQSIILQYCYGMRGDVLSDLARIKTLHEITLRNLHFITTPEFISVITSLADQLTFVDLLGMDPINDSILATLGGCHNLNYVKLESLKSITSQGVCDLVDSLKHNALKNLNIIKCN